MSNARVTCDYRRWPLLNRGRRARQGLGMGRTRASLNSDDACERVPEYEFRFWRFLHARPASGLLVVYRDVRVGPGMRMDPTYLNKST